ncbi:YchJ family metal-binding protein [Pseudoxanthomonas sp. PXM01]|uniref:YchJ family protein n=1 Tax=Pseudoxanthomonas sp. PXM01 TaxID=2769295 RepID=UPI0017841D03|nr:YchJ family metal-binding protein [Pseudoxanthomonas sp. PXM01]MBD9470829.1 SEC-C domain-containing protein [Pseudoxanthomonas sp. PXM01]
MTLCPCGTGRDYAACCGRYHAGEPAPDAESLMRSRYSAFVLGDADYLRASWHPDTRPAELGLDAAGAAKTTWLGLSVKSHRATGPETAEVEFVARYRIGGGSAVRMQESSRFVRIDGRWYYLDGEHR